VFLGIISSVKKLTSVINYCGQEVLAETSAKKRIRTHIFFGQLVMFTIGSDNWFGQVVFLTMRGNCVDFHLALSQEQLSLVTYFIVYNKF